MKQTDGKIKPVSSAGNNPFAAMGGQMSNTVKERHCKVLFAGPTGGGKTEAGLRNFPGIVCYDTEFNTDMCLDHPTIPPFMQVKTRDIRKIQAGIEAARQPIMLPGSVPLQTIMIDSGSILWNEQSDFAAELAEQRAARKNRDTDTATITQKDWTSAKRPLKRLMLAFSQTSIPFLVMTAREKDLYEEVPGYGEEKQLKKVGVVPDLVKGSLYDFNLAVRLWQENGQRCYEIIKVQGSLGEIFPQGSRGVNFPFAKFFEWAKRLEPGPEDIADKNEDGEITEVATAMAKEELDRSIPRTQSSLIQYASEHGYSAPELGAILRGAGFSGFVAEKWDAMVKAIDTRYAQDQMQSN